MGGKREIKFGVVGVCGGYGRGSHLIGSLRRTSPIQVHAVCDLDPDRMAKAKTDFGIQEGGRWMEVPDSRQW